MAGQLARDFIFRGNIRTLDASNATGYTSLVGNEFDNTIIAGQNNSSLWGNTFENDLLIGGSLNINGNSDVTYQLADGSKYKANHLIGKVKLQTNSQSKKFPSPTTDFLLKFWQSSRKFLPIQNYIWRQSALFR